MCQTERENRLDIDVTDVEAVTIWVAEAALVPSRELVVVVDTNRPMTITLAGSFGERTLEFDADTSTQRITLQGP